MTALKKAYRSDDIVVRLFESFGEKTEVNIELFGAKFTTVFSPYEVKTLMLTEDGNVREVDLLEWDI